MTRLHVPMPNGTFALLSVGEPDRVIQVDGREWRFEWSDRFGPFFLGKHGQPLAQQPGARSPVWRGLNAWAAQGKRAESDGRCVWTEPPPEPEPFHVVGNVYVCAGSAESMGKTIAHLGVRPHPIGGCEECR